MTAILLANEATLRLGFFLVILIIMAIWEALSPRRHREIPRLVRWPNNLGIVLVNTLLVRLTFPIMAISVAYFAEEHSIGLFHFTAAPLWLAFIVSLVAMDLAIYIQHVLFHAVPALWRFHRMHHADLDFDVTTGIRFHPVEILLSMSIKLAIVLVLGPPVIAVLIFEIVLNATALFNHSNVYIPTKLDRALQWLLVTPDMHRIHHSVLSHETNSNFGFNLSWWDRILGTYINQPTNGHKDMTIGIDSFRTRKDLRLDQMLIQPLKKVSHHIR